MSTALDLEHAVTPKLSEPGDHDKMSHYANKDDITKAMIEGTPCQALCGKVWVPTRDATKFPVCPECKDIFENMKFADD